MEVAFERKRMKVNIKKTKMMVCGSEGEAPKSRIDPCGVFGGRVMANLVLCTYVEDGSMLDVQKPRE